MGLDPTRKPTLLLLLLAVLSHIQVEVAELRQKLQNMETLQKELELLQRQKAASEEAALSAKEKQNSGGVWGWLAGSPSSQKS